MERKRGTSMVQAKRKTVLEDWFKRRVDELGDEAGSWEVLYCSIGLSFLSFFLCSFSFVFFFFVRVGSSSLPAFILFAYNGDSIALVDPKATPICTPTSPRRSNACPHFRVVGFDSFKSTTITKKSVEEQETLEDRNRKYENLLIGLA